MESKENLGIFGQMLVEQTAEQMERALDTIAKCMAALDPKADEKKIAQQIEGFKNLVDQELPELIVHWQQVINSVLKKAGL